MRKSVSALPQLVGKAGSVAMFCLQNSRTVYLCNTPPSFQKTLAEKENIAKIARVEKLAIFCKFVDSHYLP